MSEILSEARLDLCLYHLRFCKTRSLAQELIEKNRVRVNGEKISKSSRKVREGDVLVFPAHNKIYSIKIMGIPSKRVGAAIAQNLYREIENQSIGA